MIKYFITLILLVFIAGCIFNDDKGKGELNIAVIWPEKNSKISRAIPENCKKISILIMKYGIGGHKMIEKEIARGENQLTSNIKIEDIETGEWSISIMLKDIADNTILSTYKMIQIKEGENNLEIIFGTPQTPYELYPTNNALVTTFSAVRFEWRSIGADFPTTSSIYSELNSIKYYVYFGEDYNLDEKNILNINQEIKSTESGIMLDYSNIPILEAGKTYYWKIKAENREGSSESSINSFRVKNSVPVAIPITPSGIILKDSLNQFVWSVSDDIEGDNKYRIVLTKLSPTGGLPINITFPSTGYIETLEYNLSTEEKLWFDTGYDYNWNVIITDINGETQGPTENFEIF
jgi:hypothetical protein